MHYKKQQRLFFFIGIFAPIFFWFFESLVDDIIFHKQTFIHNLLSPAPEELWMRLIIIIGMTSFTLFVAKAIKTIENQKERIEKANEELQSKIDEKTGKLKKQIEDNKILQEELERQKNFISHTLQYLTVATFIIDKEHRVIFWNKACEILTGINAADIIGTDNQWKAFYDYKRPSLADIVLDGNEKALSNLYQQYSKSVLSEKGLHAEGWYQKLGGEDRYIIFDATPILDKNNNIIAVVETIQDVTQLKKTERKAERDRDFIKAITDSARVAIFTYEGTKFSFVNRYGEELVGYSVDELRNTNIWDIVHPEERQMVMERAMARQKGEPVSSNYEFRVVRKDGEILWVDFSASLIKYGDKQIVLGTVYDITEKKKLESQLLHAQKMEAIGRLTGGIAHDFNNILTAIIGYATILNLKMDENDPLIQNAKQILLACEKATEITQNLLAFSRKKAIETKEININDTVAMIEKILKRLIGEDIELVTNLWKEGLICLADKTQLEQVLINLATNARDAMPDGGTLSIETSLVEITPDFIRKHGFGTVGKYALITVTDTGCGMDEETKKKIFDPFFTTKEVGKGTGLGLSIVYGIVKQHNGYINVYSEVDKGTTFKIYLPICREASIAKGEEGYTKRVDLKGNNETILVAEDNKEVRQIVKTCLHDFGYIMLEAADGEEAVEIYRQNADKIALVILDVVMPKKNGKEALLEMKKINQGVKAIFTSGYTENIIHKKGILEEGVNFISKPVAPTKMLSLIKEVITK